MNSFILRRDSGLVGPVPRGLLDDSEASKADRVIYRTMMDNRLPLWPIHSLPFFTVMSKQASICHFTNDSQLAGYLANRFASSQQSTQ